jgi:hypothetical protein
MANSKELINGLIDDMAKLRDELRLKANLGALEMEDEISNLDDKYEILKSKSKEIFEVVDDSADDIAEIAKLGIKSGCKDDVLTALQLAGEEIKDGYEKIKKLV